MSNSHVVRWVQFLVSGWFKALQFGPTWSNPELGWSRTTRPFHLSWIGCSPQLLLDHCGSPTHDVSEQKIDVSLSQLRTVELEVPSVPGHALGYLPNFTDHLELNSNHLCALKSPGWYRFDPYIHGNDDLPQRTCIFDGHYHPILGKSWCGSIVQFPIHETESGSH